MTRQFGWGAIMASAQGTLAWVRRLVPALLGATLLYVTWRLVGANDAPLQVDFLFAQVELATWEALLGAFLCGAGGVGLLTLYQMARGGLMSRRYRRKLANLETEVHQLRNLPLSPESLAAPETQPEPRGVGRGSA